MYYLTCEFGKDTRRIAKHTKGDVVLDPYCGCVAAEKLGREWVGIDISEKAVELVNMQLREFTGDLFHERLGYRADGHSPAHGYRGPDPVPEEEARIVWSAGG